MNDENLKSEEDYSQWMKYTLDEDPYLFPKLDRTTNSSSDVPKRQKLAGREYGLSLVFGISNDATQSMCPVSDGSGMLVSTGCIFFSLKFYEASINIRWQLWTLWMSHRS